MDLMKYNEWMQFVDIFYTISIYITIYINISCGIATVLVKFIL